MLVNLPRRPHRLHAEARVVHGVGEYLALQAEPGPTRVRGAVLALERALLRRQHVARVELQPRLVGEHLEVPATRFAD